MSRKVVIIGGGGHAISTVAMLEGSAELAGYTATAPSEDMAIAYLGTDEEALPGLDPAVCSVHNAIGFTAGCSLELRRRVAARYAGFPQATLIAPSAWVSPRSVIGDGCAIMARATVNESTVEGMSVINTGAIIEHGCRIGENSFIGPGAILCGGVTTGHDTFIGAGAILKQGVTVAAGSVIGMGAVVTQAITEAGTYAGNPAVRIK